MKKFFEVFFDENLRRRSVGRVGSGREWYRRVFRYVNLNGEERVWGCRGVMPEDLKVLIEWERMHCGVSVTEIRYLYESVKKDSTRINYFRRRGYRREEIVKYLDELDKLESGDKIA